VAGILAEQGHGFPLLHDITDLLRTGDLTLIKPGSTPHAVEVKTRVAGQRPTGDLVEFEYEVSVWPDPTFDPSAEGAATPTALRPKPMRQISRLVGAKQEMLAELGVPFHRAGSQVPSAVIEGEDVPGPPAWQELRRVVRAAKRSGYASSAIDDTFLYVAIYDSAGVTNHTYARLGNRVSEDLLRSGILFENPTDNALSLYSIPHDERGGPQLFMPYFLLPLPRSHILDILHGRLIVVNLVNLGRIASLMRGVGLDVELRDGSAQLVSDPLVVSRTFTDNEGHSIRGDFHHLQRHLTEMAMEFRPAAYIVKVASDVLNLLSGSAMQELLKRLDE